MNLINRYEQQLKTQCAPGNCSAIVPYIDLVELLRLAKIGQSMQWISVNERRPKQSIPVLTILDNGLIETGYIGSYTGEWCSDGFVTVGTVTHWMALPVPPNKDDGDNNG